MSIRFHTSRETDAADRGHAFGEAERDAVTNTIAAYRRMLAEAVGLDDAGLRAAGREVGDRLSTAYPEIVAEIDGIAAGARASAEDLLAINARTELLAESHPAPECSLISYVERGPGPPGCIVAQTWDWHPALLPSRVCWTVQDADGRWFTTLTEAGILGKVGLNSNGLCCGLNFLLSSLDGGVGGVPIHVLLRLILGRCESIVDALDLLLNAPVTASSCITLGYAEAAGSLLAAVELSPAGAQVVWPDRSGQLVHTNHFLAPLAAEKDLGPASGADTLTRYETLRRHDFHSHEADELHRALASHLCAPPSLCRHVDESEAWPDWRASLLTVVMEPGRPRLQVVDGAPCEGRLEEVALPAPGPAAVPAHNPAA